MGQRPGHTILADAIALNLAAPLAKTKSCVPTCRPENALKPASSFCPPWSNEHEPELRSLYYQCRRAEPSERPTAAALGTLAEQLLQKLVATGVSGKRPTLGPEMLRWSSQPAAPPCLAAQLPSDPFGQGHS